jgi:(4S)-4-hydroxy-5-phosphonooxypentane-2,3-dione isomerase
MRVSGQGLASQSLASRPGQPEFGRYRFPQAVYEEESVSQVAILARVTVKEGKSGQYLAALKPLLEQARKEPGTLLYAVHRSADDPEVFWTTEVYADDAAFAAHRATEVHAAAEPVFTELIAAADVTIGETVMATGLDG